MSRATFDPRDYWDRRLDRVWSLQGVGLVRVSRQYNGWLYRVRHRIFHRALASLDVDPRGAKVLDIGAGVGFYIDRWLRLGADVVGVDIADSAVRRLRPRYPQARLERLDISDDVTALPGGFDVAGAFDVLFHVVDDARHQRAMENVYALLRPGGWFVFTDVFARRHVKPSPHYVRRTREEIEDAVRAAGFEVVRREPAFVLMNNPYDSNRIHRGLWRRVMMPLMRHPIGGAVLGALLYGPELVLTRVLRESPTTEVMICRKPG